jgi:hypothetical protein
MYSLYKNEYRIFKPVEIIIRRGIKGVRRKIEEMNQFRLQYIYTWKCHKETFCIAIVNKNVILKIKSDNRVVEQVLPGGVGTGGSREDVGKGCGRVNILQIFCTRVCKFKNETIFLTITVETISGMGGGG